MSMAEHNELLRLIADLAARVEALEAGGHDLHDEVIGAQECPRCGETREDCKCPPKRRGRVFAR